MAQITMVERNNRKRAAILFEKTSVDLRSEAKKLFVAGVSSGRIARELGIPLGTLRAWSSRYRWKAEKSRVETKIVTKISGNIENTETIVDAAVSEHTVKIGKLVASQIDRLASLPVKDEHSIVEIANALKTFDDVARRNLGMATEAPAINFGFNLGASTPVKKSAKIVDI